MQVLEDQLFNDSLYRTWSTGAFLLAHHSSDDGEYSVSCCTFIAIAVALQIVYLKQLQPYFEKEGEYGLSKDVDVVLWLDYRAYHRKPPLREALGFVIVDETLHEEFDEFKQRETSLHISYLPPLELIRLWCSTQKSCNPTTMEKFGNQYIVLQSSEMDELCYWVQQMRERFLQEGNSVFNVTVSDSSY